MLPIPVNGFLQVLQNNIFPLIGAFPWELRAKADPNEDGYGYAGEIVISLVPPGLQDGDRIMYVAFQSVIDAARNEGDFVAFTKRIMDELNKSVRGRNTAFLVALGAELADTAQDIQRQTLAILARDGRKAVARDAEAIRSTTFMFGTAWIKAGELQDVDDPSPVVDLNPPAMGLVRPARAYLDD